MWKIHFKIKVFCAQTTKLDIFFEGFHLNKQIIFHTRNIVQYTPNAPTSGYFSENAEAFL